MCTYSFMYVYTWFFVQRRVPKEDLVLHPFLTVKNYEGFKILLYCKLTNKTAIFLPRLGKDTRPLDCRSSTKLLKAKAGARGPGWPHPFLYSDYPRAVQVVQHGFW